ncbi:MAG TPA: C25 family peptidase propeptide domain-containing protein, partial [Anaerolineaceae bacterium]|nr:C25 family peptidase propeptide domain-containing protein [Anaerolineaceae bacterium]
ASLLTADESGVDFVLETPWKDLLLEPVEVEGKNYTRISLPDWTSLSHEGKPALPFHVEQIGVPFGAEVTVEVTPGPAHRIALDVPVLPVASRVIDEEQPLVTAEGSPMPVIKDVLIEDADVYGGWGIYPGSLAEVSGDFILRQQRIVGISSYPVQYDVSAGELVVYENLKVHVSFTGGTTARVSFPSESEAYEELMQGELLNYGQALSFRSAERVTPPATDDTVRADAQLNGDMEDWTPPDPGWRVKVRADGMYKLTYEEMAAAGLPVTTLESATLQLFHFGQEVAIKVDLGTDGMWGAGDFIVFYGQAIQSKYTTDSVYWLTYGKAAGLRMALVNGTPANGTVPAAFQYHLHLEDSKLYLSNIKDMGEREHFVWARLYPPSTPEPWTYSFTLPSPTSSPAVLRIAFYGGSDPAADPDHHLQVSLNGGLTDTPEANIIFNGNNWYIAKIPVPAGLLRASPEENVLSVTDLLDLGVTRDIVFIDWIELDYPNNFISQADKLHFSFPTVGT